uniref:RRM domain-containing protein n=1 Tax=Araucaria cunninghamii TaxID=56994 RepID=A0A0D6R8D5_ARACU
MFANSGDQRSGVGVKWGTPFARDRVQGLRFEEKSHLFGVQKTEHETLQPSRNLWVGNVSQHVTETELAEQFSRFGEVENITVYSARNYAFINFRKEEDAVIAKRSLQGVVLGGLALRIEFAKGDSHLSSIHHADDLQRPRDERRFADMMGLSGARDSRILVSNPDVSLSEKHKGDKDAEPSEVLWIGFPAYMKVDEMNLRRVFSPFGDIEHVTTFPGRTYAFVQFRSVVAACRAKEALQGKLFNNPRVNICFSKSEVGPVEHGRISANGTLAFSHKVPAHSGVGAKVAENLRQERTQAIASGRLCMPSASFGPNSDRMLSGSNVNFMGRVSSMRTMSAESKIGSGYDDIRATRIGSEIGVAKEVTDLPLNSPGVERSPYWRSNASDKFRGSGPCFEDNWDSSADDVSGRDIKRPRFAAIPGRDPSDLAYSEQGRDLQQFCSPRTGAVNPGPESYRFSRFPIGTDGDLGASHRSSNLISESTRHSIRPSQQLDRPWNVPNNFEQGIASSIPPPLDSGKWDGSVSDAHHGTLNEEWKWQGTIAKGGTPVCRARCFPVGKVLDVTLPEFLNCTARTGLDMLAKHFYQAGSVGVVFFVPETDPDIIPYNEFMHYLGEKQRAAVTKLAEGTTLFLVPPSQFSEQVLKVPGKVSISGVILKFPQPNSSYGPPHLPSSELMNTQPPSFLHKPSLSSGVPMHEDSTYPKPPSPLHQQRYSGQGNASLYSENYQSPSRSFSSFQVGPPSVAVSSVYQTQGSGASPPSGSFEGTMKVTVVNDNIRHHLSSPNQGSVSPWSSLNQERSHVSNSRAGTFVTDSSTYLMPLQSEFPSTQNSFPVQQQQSCAAAANSEQHFMGAPNNPTIGGPTDQNQHLHHPMPPASGSIPLQPDHLAQLANLLGQQSHSSQPSVAQPLQENEQKPPPPMPQAVPNFTPVQQSNMHIHSNAPFNSTSGQFTYGQPLQQQTSQQGMLSHAGHLSDVGAEAIAPENQKQNDSREESESDPQKRLQATLQLAAALLQQIQQQARVGDPQ